MVTSFICYGSLCLLLLGLVGINGSITDCGFQLHHVHQPNAHNNPFLTSLPMVSFGGLGGGNSLTSAQQGLPRDVKDAISKCRVAVQEALKNRMSRMEVEFPVGTKFGVEKGKQSKRGSPGATTPTSEVLETSDRELARLFVEMFQPVGSDRIAVVYKDERLADVAKKQWKSDDGASQSHVVSLDRRRKSASASGAAGKKKKAVGFAAKLAAEVEDEGVQSGPFQLPSNTEVALFVAPGPKELVIVEQVCAKVGMATLVIVLNGRLSRITNFGTLESQKLFQHDFEPVFCLSAAPQAEAPGCLLYRAYPNDWILARKPKVGQPKPILTLPLRPSTEDCRKAYEGMELSDVERGVENLLENVAGWFQ